METIRGSPDCMLLDVGNESHDLASLYAHIRDGFKELGDGVEKVRKVDMIKYVMHKSRGKFSPMAVSTALDRFKI